MSSSKTYELIPHDNILAWFAIPKATPGATRLGRRMRVRNIVTYLCALRLFDTPPTRAKHIKHACDEMVQPVLRSALCQVCIDMYTFLQRAEGLRHVFFVEDRFFRFSQIYISQ
jgi:hypothetical protein